MTNYTTTRNEQFNSYEVAFNGIPTTATREALKAHGYRWHGVKKIWYGYTPPEDFLNGCNVEQPNAASAKPERTNGKTADKEEQARLWAKVGETWTDNPKWLDYYKEQMERLIELENGAIVGIEKPRIETDFCFGYGWNGIISGDDSNNAQDCASALMHDGGKYFVEQNTQRIREQIAQLKGEKTENNWDGDYAKYRAYYYDTGRNGKETVAAVTVMTWQQVIRRGEYIRNCHELTPGELAAEMGYHGLTDTDTANYIAALEKVKEHLDKRLETYLKRYGTSKLNIWTYLRD